MALPPKTPSPHGHEPETREPPQAPPAAPTPHEPPPAPTAAPPPKPAPPPLTKEMARACLFAGHRLAKKAKDGASDEEKQAAAADWFAYRVIDDHKVICRPYKDEELDKLITDDLEIVA